MISLADMTTTISRQVLRSGAETHDQVKDLAIQIVSSSTARAVIQSIEEGSIGQLDVWFSSQGMIVHARNPDATYPAPCIVAQGGAQVPVLLRCLADPRPVIPGGDPPVDMRMDTLFESVSSDAPARNRLMVFRTLSADGADRVVAALRGNHFHWAMGDADKELTFRSGQASYWSAVLSELARVSPTMG